MHIGCESHGVANLTEHISDRFPPEHPGNSTQDNGNLLIHSYTVFEVFNDVS